jgi:GTP-binding protein HflX
MPRPTVIIDTVGFVRKLPHHLVASFRSTMEEAVSADLVLHVIDSTHEEQAVVGREVLAELGIPESRVIEVFNKEDLTRGFGGTSISALTGRGIEKLVGMIRERELAGGEVLHLEIPHEESRTIAKLHEIAEVHEQRSGDRVMQITAWVPQNAIHNFAHFSVSDSLKTAKVG